MSPTQLHTQNKEKKDFIDPLITSHLQQYSNTNTKTSEKCATRLRNFIEICMRFINVPQRIQCSVGMVLPECNSTDYVCKLVKHGDGYGRLIHADKVQKTHQPIALPLGTTISTYIEFYLCFCRPPPSSERNAQFVFLSKRGGKWKKASSDLKQYMDKHLKIPVQQLDPTGRFVHASRNIGIAAFSSQVNFDISAVRAFASVCRHSSAVAERYYSIWEKEHKNRTGVQLFTQHMLPDTDQPTQQRAETLVHLSSPPTLCTKWYQHTRQPSGTEVFQYTVHDVGCQTEPCSDLGSSLPLSHTPPQLLEDQPAAKKQKTQTHTAQSTVPVCTSCQSAMKLGGPYGNSKHADLFCRFFLPVRQLQQVEATQHVDYRVATAGSSARWCQQHQRQTAQLERHGVLLQQAQHTTFQNDSLNK